MLDTELETFKPRLTSGSTPRAWATCGTPKPELARLNGDAFSEWRKAHYRAGCGWPHFSVHRNDDGGSIIDFAPMHEVKGWHKTSPDLTGAGRLFTRCEEEGLVKFLETGLGPTGNKADPPMPLYTLKHEDAQAIVDYLKSLQ